MQIPVLNGMFTDEDSDFRTSYPHNYVPVPKPQGISKGYLRPADGLVALGDAGQGLSRGGINWNDVCYRVSGTKLISISETGTVTVIGDVGGTNEVTFDYSFDYLGITSNNNLFLYDGTTLTQVTDSDLGTVIDHIWVDGYFMTTDGEFIVVIDLDNPFSVSLTKYGSSEVDPDRVKALIKLRNEPHALNRYTIEVFSNIGGNGFPFQVVDGGQIQKGTIGTHTCCEFLDSIAFIGGGKKESLAVWLGAAGVTAKISNREIDTVLAGYTEAVLSLALLETKVDKGHQHLYIHLPDQTLVYDASASRVVGEQVWFTLGSGLTGQPPQALSQYKCKNLVWCYNKWLVGDPSSTNLGYLSNTVSSHWGDVVGWNFGTTMLYNDGSGAIVHELELVCLSGRAALGVDSTIWTSWSLDGETWSQERSIQAGKQGQRNKRLMWLGQGNMEHWRMQYFRGTSDARLSIARLEARVEPLSV